METIRTPYNQRDGYQETLHREYGELLYLTDLDSLCDSMAGLRIFMETNGRKPTAIAEFKNDNEAIYLWKLAPMIYLADCAKIPAYVAVMYREPCIFYHVIPLNDNCRKILCGDSHRVMSEATYIKFLHGLRGTLPDIKTLAGKSTEVPAVYCAPNIKG